MLKMNRMKWLLPLLLGLHGCTASVPAVSGLSHGATLVLQPQILAGRHVQANVPLYTSNSIATLSVTPYVNVGTAGSPVFRPLLASTGQATDSSNANLWYNCTQASPSIDWARAVTFTNLAPSTRYRVIARAYGVSGSQISSDASSSVEVDVTSDDRPTMATLPLKLDDSAFSGSTTVTLVRAGGSTYDHVLLSFYTVAGNGSLTAVPGATSSLTGEFNGQVVTLAKLTANTTYRVLAEAQDSSNAVLASSSVNIVVADDDAPATSSLTITLPQANG